MHSLENNQSTMHFNKSNEFDSKRIVFIFLISVDDIETVQQQSDESNNCEDFELLVDLERIRN